MDREEYQKHYRKYYRTRKRVISFPLENDEYEKLLLFANSRNISANKLTRELVVNFVNANNAPIISKRQEEMIAEYIRVSRGIANNINQLAYRANIGEYIDVNILISMLKSHEDGFKNLITKL
jgi:hypothetical protein